MGKRRRDREEYERTRYLKKKDRNAELKREKIEKCYMGKEDVKALTATLAPPSAPTSPSERLCSTIEDASTLIVEQRYSVGEVLLLEANTQERGYVYTHFLFFTFFFSLHALVSFVGAKR